MHANGRPEIRFWTKADITKRSDLQSLLYRSEPSSAVHAEEIIRVILPAPLRTDIISIRKVVAATVVIVISVAFRGGGCRVYRRTRLNTAEAKHSKVYTGRGLNSLLPAPSSMTPMLTSNHGRTVSIRPTLGGSLGSASSAGKCLIQSYRTRQYAEIDHPYTSYQ